MTKSSFYLVTLTEASPPTSGRSPFPLWALVPADVGQKLQFNFYLKIGKAHVRRWKTDFIQIWFDVVFVHGVPFFIFF